RRSMPELAFSVLRQLSSLCERERCARWGWAAAAPEREVAAECWCAARLEAVVARLPVAQALPRICECVLHPIRPALVWESLPTAGWSSIFDLGFAVFSLLRRLCLRAI